MFCRNLTTFKNDLSHFGKPPVGWHFHTHGTGHPHGGLLEDHTLLPQPRYPLSLKSGFEIPRLVTGETEVDGM